MGTQGWQRKGGSLIFPSEALGCPPEASPGPDPAHNWLSQAPHLAKHWDHLAVSGCGMGWGDKSGRRLPLEQGTLASRARFPGGHRWQGRSREGHWELRCPWVLGSSKCSWVLESKWNEGGDRKVFPWPS